MIHPGNSGWRHVLRIFESIQYNEACTCAGDVRLIMETCQVWINIRVTFKIMQQNTLTLTS